MASLDQIISDAQTQIQGVISTLTTGAAAGSLDATAIQALQTQAVALAADLTQALPASQQLLQQLAQCQGSQPNPAPAPAPAPPATSQMQVDAKAAALVALGALVIGGFGGYILKGATSGSSGARGSHKRHNPLKEEARRRRLPPKRQEKE